MSTAVNAVLDNLRYLQEHPPAEPDLPEDEPDIEGAPEFDLGILPGPFATYIDSQAKAIGVPVEMIAMPMVAYFGSLIGNRLSIRMKAGWVQYPSLFVGIVAPPGAAKSPAINAARWPLDRLQGDAHTLYKSLLQQWEADTDAWTAKPREERGEKPVRPRLRHFYSTDLTIEALVSMLETAPGIAISRDELLSWIKSMDQYRGGKGSDRQQFLSLWSSSPIKQDRRGGDTIFQAKPVASIVGGIQPDFLSDLHDKDGRRDGFIERILLIRPDVTESEWSEEEADMNLLGGVLETFADIDRRLTGGDSPEDVTRQVQLQSDARRLWIDWYNHNQALTAESSGMRHGFYSKLPLQVARFALILNTMWNPDDPQRLVSAERIADAIWLGEYCRTHFNRTLPLIGESQPSRIGGIEQRVLRILRIEGEQSESGWVSRATILVKLRNVKAEALTPALQELERQGLAESRHEQTTTKPREEWRIISPTSAKDSNNSKISRFSKNLDLGRVESSNSSNPSQTFEEEI